MITFNFFLYFFLQPSSCQDLVVPNFPYFLDFSQYLSRCSSYLQGLVVPNSLFSPQQKSLPKNHRCKKPTLTINISFISQVAQQVTIYFYSRVSCICQATTKIKHFIDGSMKKDLIYNCITSNHQFLIFIFTQQVFNRLRCVCKVTQYETYLQFFLNNDVKFYSNINEIHTI